MILGTHIHVHSILDPVNPTIFLVLNASAIFGQLYRTHRQSLQSAPCHPVYEMEKTWLLALFLLHIMPREEAAFSVGAGVGIGVGGNIPGSGGGGGGANVWIGGGINTPTTPNPPPPSSSSPKLESAYSAFQAWKSSITEDPQGVLRSWVGPNVCAYRGVFCAASQESFNGGPPSTDNVVLGIDLNHANLKGTLVTELSLLTDMTLLHLNTNRFTGSIPESFKDLVSLQELDLSNNRLSGPFPTVVLDMPSLIYLDLRYNDFWGPLPDSLFVSKLDAILLNNNRFHGELPQTLASARASVVNLANNNLSGPIPPGFGFGFMSGGGGKSIREILLTNNRLTGCLPEGLGLFSDMQVLDVSYNSLTGHVPDTLSCLSQIEVLNLGHNELSGVLPDVVCSLKNLMNLTVAYNFFSGVSQECARLVFRGGVGFDFSANCIPNRQMQRPQPDCSVVPGVGLSCLRIPVGSPSSPSQSLVCGAMALLEGTIGDLTEGIVGGGDQHDDDDDDHTTASP